MASKATRDWLEHSALKKAQERAVRLCAMSHAVIPAEKTLRRQLTEQILSDVMDLALNVDFVAQRGVRGPIAISTDPLWPASGRAAPEISLQEICARITGAEALDLAWETPKLDTPPFRGPAHFAGAISVKSSKGDVDVAIGALAMGFFELLKEPGAAQAAS